MKRLSITKTVIITGSLDIKLAEKLIQHGAATKNISDRISTISSAFLGIPYKASTIDEHAKEHEQLVIDFSGVDCFTLLDYVESMRRASSWAGFIRCLRLTRYKKGTVAFKNRNHFFTDWIKNNSSHVTDITKKIAGSSAVAEYKELNEKSDGSLYVNGIKPARRKITYIPSSAMDQGILNKLRTGDYAGIYSDKPGLDVSHVGIIIKTASGAKLRHASSASASRCVVDENLLKYLSTKPGLILLRPV